MNLAHLFLRSARRAGDAPAVALGTRPVQSWRELVRRGATLATGLREHLGLGRGDRIALVMENRPEYLEIELAAWWAGLAIVPINAKLHRVELAWILDNAAAAACFVSPKLAPMIADFTGAVVEIDTPAYARLFTGEPWPMTEVTPDTLAWLFYTSGTTGRPKGAMITHGNLRAMTYAYFADVDRVGPTDAILHAAPMSHGSGCYISPFTAAGACHVVPESGGFDEAEVFELIRAWPGSHIFAAPTMVKRLVRQVDRQDPELGNLATIIYGGAPMYLADLEAAHAAFGFRLAQIYGQGESPMCITALDKEAHARAAAEGRAEILGSAGTPQAVVEVRIGDAEGRPLPQGELGEIMARGDSVVPGYWADPETTQRVMGDGWLRTGDVGSLSETGHLTLKDRSKDLIISGGSNVYPREVEEVLLSHPKVREVAVLGLPDPDWGERVVACVVVDGAVDEAELDRHCLARIARFKRPKRYRLLSELPKNSYGKILKRELKSRFAKEGEHA